MPYGMSLIRNTQGNVVIDGTNLPLVVLVEGTKSKVGDLYEIPVPAGLGFQPILFVAWALGDQLVNLGVENGKFQIRTPDGSGPSSLSYFLCAFERPTTQSDYGFEIFDANGDLVFSSTQKYMRLRDIVDIAAPPGNPNNFVFNHTAAASLEPMTVPYPRLLGVQVINNGQARRYIFGGCRRTTTSVFEFQEFEDLIIPGITPPLFPFPRDGSSTVLLGKTF